SRSRRPGAPARPPARATPRVPPPSPHGETGAGRRAPAPAAARGGWSASPDLRRPCCPCREHLTGCTTCPFQRKGCLRMTLQKPRDPETIPGVVAKIVTELGDGRFDAG